MFVKIIFFLAGIRRMIRRFIKSIYKRLYLYEITKQAKMVGTNLKVNNKSHATPNTILGNNVNFNGMDIRGEGQVIIGNNFHSGEGCLIETSQHNYDNGIAIPYDDTQKTNTVTIGDNVWFGTNVTVLGCGDKPITIGEGAIIQFGSVVVSSIPPLAIAGGHPAKVFKYRDKDHYYNLKEKGMFN